MARSSIPNLAQQVGLSVEQLLARLQDAGIAGKGAEDELNDEEKMVLLRFLRGGGVSRGGGERQQVVLKRRTTGEIKQTSRTGAARTVHVEVKKRRTFVKGNVIAARQAEEARRRQAEIDEKTRKYMAEEERKRAEAEKAAEARRAKAGDAAGAVAGSAGQSPAATGPAAGESTPPAVALRVDRPKVAVTGAKPVIIAPAPPKTPGEAGGEGDSGAGAGAGAAGAGAAGAGAGAAGTGAAEQSGESKTAKVESKSGRTELHVAKDKRRRRRKPLRKIRRISSAIADQHAFAKPTAPMVREVNVPESISVGELAQAMSIKAGEVIKAMMGMGLMVTINEFLDQDTAILVVEELGHIAKAAEREDPEAELLAAAEHGRERLPRPPVVTVMGHVDHGKTSLLDYLRKARVAGEEAGGITQHIGAYKVHLPQGEICFLDTPGHEAFSAMRVRGGRAADLVILVVAADDGVMPQTIEAISHARAAGAQLIVAINKVDREEADVERVKRQLTQHGIVGEAMGGEVLMNEISALTGRGVDALLESVLLQAEVLDLTARASGPAVGQVVEARLDKGRGPVATVLVQQGELHKGDVVLAGRESGRVRVLTDDGGRLVNKAGPSTPVEIQGLAGVPVAGDDLFVVGDERKAREMAMYRQGKFKEIKLAKQQKRKLDAMFNRMQEAESQTLNLVIKADVQGSVEAVSEAVEKVAMHGITVKVVHGMVGGINESDVNLAVASGAVIVGFNVRADATARKLIENEGVEVHYHNVIYDVIDRVKAAMGGMLAPVSKEQQVGFAEVRDVFRAAKVGLVAGCIVVGGAVRRNLPARVLRENAVVYEGEVESLRRFKEDVAEVKNGLECGICVKNYNDIKVGDFIEVFEMVEVAPEI